MRKAVASSTRSGRPRGRAEALRAQIASRARALYDTHFVRAQKEPRGAVAELTILVDSLKTIIHTQLNHDVNWKQNLRDTLNSLGKLLEGDGLLSAYEIHSSGLVPAMRTLLYPHSTGNCFLFIISFFLN